MSSEGSGECAFAEAHLSLCCSISNSVPKSHVMAPLLMRINDLEDGVCSVFRRMCLGWESKAFEDRIIVYNIVTIGRDKQNF